jgi:hypothetical protein
MSTPFLLSLLLFTPKLDFELPIPLTYKSEVSWDNEFITYYGLKDGVIVDLEIKFFVTFQDYLYQLSLGSYRKSEFERDRASNAVSSGLLPVIDLPLKFPGPVAGIIGQGGQLDVNGSQRIDFVGSSTKNFTQQQNEFTQESWFPQLHMEQHLNVNLKGTIGEKVHVFIDHDSEREFDLSNTIKLEYKGCEDEIVQSIKAGNTELSLPGIKLIGGGTSHQGLFGVKSEAKIGPVGITAIASREEAENQSKVWSGGGVSDREMKIDDINFARARFFALAPPKYVHSLSDPHSIYSGSPDLLPTKIISLSVYIDEEQRNNQGEGAFGKAFDVPNGHHSVPDSIDTLSGWFVEKFEGLDKFYSLGALGLETSYGFPVLELNRGLMSGDLLAIRWTYVDHNGDTTTVGEVLPDTTLKGLQTIKRDLDGGAEDTSYVSWWYELKNRYSLGGADVSDLELKVFRYNRGGGEDYEILPNSDTTYRKFMGLETSRGLIRADVFDSLRGTITFPSPYPFIVDTFLRPIDSLGMESDSIYDMPNFTNYTPKYYLWVKYKGIRTEYYLDMMNIIENSETVKINNIVQTRGTHYTIDYESGLIKFITPDAEDVNAVISVDFQYVPIFQPTTKNLLGTRAHSKIGELGEVSSTFLYYSTGCRDLRPTLGNEPGRIILGELVGNVSTESNWLTRWVDRLPLVETETPSSFSVQGNVGFSRPNPNTRGEVYLDDMDGAKSSTSLGLSRASWSYGSLPSEPGIDVDDFAQVLWYNPPHITARELYPDLPERQGSQTKSTLLLRLPEEADWRYPTADSIYWTSLQTCILARGMDFSQSEYLEVWVKGNRGILHLDVGTDIPEDCMRRDGYGDIRGPNDTLETEDKDNNGKVDESEDVGLDGIDGTDGTGKPGDDGNDDYGYLPDNPDDYSTINGTEGNGTGIIDGEDLDRDELLNEDLNYFSFVIDVENDVPTISRSNGWKLFRIPLAAGESGKEGIPQWECTKYARIWIEGLRRGDDIQIAGLDVIGNKWKHKGSDSVKIAVKNNWEDLDYTSPAGIDLKKDPVTKEAEKEQSLILRYTDLDTLTEGGGYTLYTKARNFVQYTALKFWLRQPDIREGKFFIRVGGDISNYYEYRTGLSTTLWEEITIDLEEIAQLKLEKSSTDSLYRSGDYRICGNPSFTNVCRIELGVVNEDSVDKISGEVWINELRLTDPRRESGVAGNVSVSTKLADVGDLSVTYRGNDPYFQSLGNFSSMREAFATNSLRSLGLHGGLQLSKLLPAQWGMQIPLGLDVSTSSTIPKYQASSDVKLTEKESEKQSSEALTRTGSISISKSGSKNPILKHTVDNISTRFNYKDHHSEAFTATDSSQSYSGSVSYALSPPLPPIKIKGFTLKYYPEQISTSTSYSYAMARGYRKTEMISRVVRPGENHVDTVWTLTNLAPPTRNVGKDGGFSYRPITPLSLNYNLSISNDLNLDRDDSRYDAGKKRYDTETGRGERVGGQFTPSFFGFFSPKIGYSSNYQESHGAELELTRNIGNSNSMTFSVPVNLTKTLGIVTGLRNEELDTVATPGSPHWLLMHTEKVVRKLHSPSLSHSISRSSLFHSLLDPPDYRYRWGIDEEPYQCPADNRNRAQITRNYAVNSVGLQAGVLSVQGGWSRSMSESETMGMGSETFSRSTKFPQLRASLSGLQKLFSLKNWCNTIGTSFDYTTNRGESGPKSEEPNAILTDRATGFSITSQWKQGLSLSLTSSFSAGRDENTGIGAKTLESKGASYNVHGSYSFRAPKGIKLPLLSHIKWTSDLNFDLSATYSTNSQKNVKSDTPLRDSRSVNIQPRLGYNFSTAVRGGASTTYSQHWDETGGTNTRTVNAGFFAEFSF